jgi:protein TonB
LQRRLSGLGLATVVNLLLLLVLMGLGIVEAPKRPDSTATTIDLVPESHSAASTQAAKTVARQTSTATNRPLPKPPPIVLPVKPTITPPSPPAKKQQAWIEMSHDQLASADLRNIASSDDGSAGDSEVVGRGPHGELLFNAEWAREPTNAELDGYLPHNPQDGWGLVECKTIPGDRVDDCIELDQYPLGSHLASAVRQAAWQFRVRPPRKGGKELVGSWVRIRIEYSFDRSTGSGAD